MFRSSLTLVLALAGSLVAAQIPPIGIIDFYGLTHTTEQQIRDALQIREGTTLPESDAAARQTIEAAKQRIRALPGVRGVQVNLVCCDAGRSILYVGIVEAGGNATTFAPPPRGSVRLHDDVIRAGDAFDEALQAAVMNGRSAEDDSRGHSLSSDAKVRAIEEQFVAFAARDETRLRDVLAHASHPADRALAAQVLGYAADKKSIVAPLSAAMRDEDADVRNNAMRALAIIAGYADRNPELRIRVAADPFVDLLNSPFWTDRNKAAFALTELTRKRETHLLALLRERAMPSLVEMARWTSRGHARMALVIVGRLAGLTEDAIMKAIASNDRDVLISAAGVAGARR